ncbi:BTB/POZ domain-containing protein [Dichanthelium oligosanthes]|uniref:BTB/POZ domain-containing protein n=1 Tax=Dichanthelium oligosanthes TaxID=888268 RepID=A0A1E5ULP9_9POAL|nr:BTB/POZ domain-containing protein [Dichanthelium oligosanthes]
MGSTPPTARTRARDEVETSPTASARSMDNLDVPTRIQVPNLFCSSEGSKDLVKKNIAMKYMKLGTKPDTFYTEEAVRSVVSDVPADLIIHVNNTKYQLHKLKFGQRYENAASDDIDCNQAYKFPLLLKCGLLQRLCSDTDDGDEEPVPVALHDIPGGEEAFELCAKFCYGISISISAANLVPAMLAARFLRMTEAVAKGNLVAKLETFFDSCVLQGWKDSVTALQAAWRVSGWSESRIVQPCIDSIVEKILMPPSKVTWSYTYTRPGYTRKPNQSVPKDWWTEDISELDIEVFRSVLSTVRASRLLPPPLIGEALHVYACKHLVDSLHAGATANGVRHQAQSSAAGAGAEETLAKQRRVLESIVTMIPGEPGSVTGRFLLRLLRVANYVSASSSTRAQLIRQAGSQLHEARAADLLIPLPSDPHAYDEHPELSKADKKRLCRLIDCRKLSPDVRAQAISNDRMPLRTIVQLLFIEQERTMGAAAGASHGGVAVAPDLASVDAISRLATRTKEDEPAASSADHKSDVHRPRRDHARVADGAAAAMRRSLSASTKTPTPVRKERTPEERGSRMRNKQ